MTYFSITFFLFLNIFIIIFPLISSQLDDPSLSKLLACMSIIHQELNSEEPDPNIYSVTMLKCYMTISDSQARSLLMGIEAGKNPLSKSEIRKLTDYDSLKDLSQNEVKQKSIELERTFKKFKKMQEDIMGGKKPEEMAEDYDDDYDYDDEYGSEQPSSINFLSLIPKGFFGIIGIFSNYISLFIVFALVYFLLLALRKMSDSDKKIKKKKKKEEPEEEDNGEEEEQEEQDKEENKKSNNKKNSKNNKSEKGKKKDIKND
jgi:hypothetical protein